MRQTKYDSSACAKVRALGKLGYSITEAAAHLGIRHPTFADWEKRFPEFRKAARRVRRNSERWKKLRLARLLLKREDELEAALMRVRQLRVEAYLKHGIKPPKSLLKSVCAK